MKRKNTSFGPFYVKRMSETRVTDLKLRLGFPYIFVHQGHCEHLMIFSDLRLMNVNDIHDLNEYPFCIYEALNPIKCCACKDAFAK
jgi:snRNA-activating protein complex subunit 3